MINDTNSANNYYLSRFTPEAERIGVWREICDYIQPFIPVKASVLDIGAGYCSFINHIQADKKYAVDLFPGFAQYAYTDVETFIGSCQKLGFCQDNGLDVVFASNLLEHLTREATTDTLSEIRRVLKAGGQFIIIQPNFRYCYRDYFDDYTHLQIFTDRALVDLLMANGFSIERIEAKFIPFSLKSRLPKWPWLVKLYLKIPLRPFAGQMLIIARSEIAK